MRAVVRPHAHGSTEAAKALADRFLAAGFDPQDVLLLTPADHPTKGNLVVRLRGRRQGRSILYIGHLDVVPDDDIVGNLLQDLVEVARRRQQAGLHQAVEDVFLGLGNPLPLGL